MYTGEELKREEELRILDRNKVCDEGDREGSREKDPTCKQKN